ncbi:Wzz/FepE/Etk N-terminal domain-containing protein [Hoeflea ulvae]|uniref:Wzz/FepE/Etk N-terminal domain-containing protein n=1 Tax=Hoeflea ulvae TaxID=2983764 RepID=A0ABT3YCC9_9HYPH|nr:Wzz/FepE/Etk N-terminal domain-containing protein [Hoeflea ulvae]MCY0093548.1 Wzz/FepE/Etk N-terminal domain-containing protein [Hoeflea ulvae]
MEAQPVSEPPASEPAAAAKPESEPEAPAARAATVEPPRIDDQSAARQVPPPSDRRQGGPAQHGPEDQYHWYAAPPSGGNDGSRPLLDISILLSSVWRYRRQIALATIGGAVMGVLVALSTPHKYYAESRLFVDPREIQVTDDDMRNQQLSTEAMLAITDSQLQILSSTSVLEKVVADLGLARDPEFNGSLSIGGISGGLTLIREIFTGTGDTSEAEQKALEKLRDALYVSRDAKTFVIIIGVETRDAEKSALIANQIVDTYLDSEGQAQSSLLERTSESIDTRLNALRNDLDAAEREVERFKAENGLVGVGGQYIDDKVILALSEQLATARAMKVGIKVKADNLARLKPDDVLSGAFPEELLSANLTALRKQYTDTRSSAETLATRLGPKHPQYIAAQSALNTISSEIRDELRRIVASSQTELQRAVETEQELASQMAVAKSRAMDQSVEFVTLRELERKATATRGIYEAFLTRSRETSERSNLLTRNIRVISAAEPPLRNIGPSRKLIAIGGMFAGLFAGIGVALLVGAVDSIRAYNGGPVQARFQNPPFGSYPQAPDPDPRRPSGGPSGRTRSRREPDVDRFEAAADRETSSLESAIKAYAGIRARDDAEHPAPEPAPAVTPVEPVHATGTPTARDDSAATPAPQESRAQASPEPVLAGAQPQPRSAEQPPVTAPRHQPSEDRQDMPDMHPAAERYFDPDPRLAQQSRPAKPAQPQHWQDEAQPEPQMRYHQPPQQVASYPLRTEPAAWQMQPDAATARRHQPQHAAAYPQHGEPSGYQPQPEPRMPHQQPQPTQASTHPLRTDPSAWQPRPDAEAAHHHQPQQYQQHRPFRQTEAEPAQVRSPAPQWQAVQPAPQPVESRFAPYQQQPMQPRQAEPMQSQPMQHWAEPSPQHQPVLHQPSQPAWSPATRTRPQQEWQSAEQQLYAAPPQAPQPSAPPQWQPQPAQPQAFHARQYQQMPQQEPGHYPEHPPQVQRWLTEQQALQQQPYQPHSRPQHPAQAWQQPAPAGMPYPEQARQASMPVQPQPVYTAPVAPHAVPAPQPEQVAQQPHKPAPVAQPAPAQPPMQAAANPSVDEIRRNLERLRSRIDGYGAARNSA